VTKLVTVIAVAVGLLFFVLAIALAGVSLAASFIFALGMTVAFVPEGLLPTVTLALALGVSSASPSCCAMPISMSSSA
jgi:magnesium-transporting ATPase (P-type)